MGHPRFVMGKEPTTRCQGWATRHSKYLTRKVFQNKELGATWKGGCRFFKEWRFFAEVLAPPLETGTRFASTIWEGFSHGIKNGGSDGGHSADVMNQGWIETGRHKGGREPFDKLSEGSGARNFRLRDDVKDLDQKEIRRSSPPSFGLGGEPLPNVSPKQLANNIVGDL